MSHTQDLPAPIARYLADGTLEPWRRKRDIFSLKGIEARIKWKDNGSNHALFVTGQEHLIDADNARFFIPFIRQLARELDVPVYGI